MRPSSRKDRRASTNQYRISKMYFERSYITIPDDHECTSRKRYHVKFTTNIPYKVFVFSPTNSRMPVTCRAENFREKPKVSTKHGFIRRNSCQPMSRYDKISLRAIRRITSNTKISAFPTGVFSLKTKSTPNRKMQRLAFKISTLSERNKSMNKNEIFAGIALRLRIRVRICQIEKTWFNQ